MNNILSIYNFLKRILLYQPATRIYYSFNITLAVGWFVIFTLLFSVYILQSSFLILIFLFTLSLIPLFSIIPSHWSIHSFTHLVLDAIISILLYSKMLRFFYVIYLFWYQCLSLRYFKILYTFLYFMCLCYVMTIRYIFYLKLCNEIIPFWVYISYFFTFLFILIKALTESSSFFIALLYTKFPVQKNIFLSELPEDIGDNTPTPPTKGVLAYNKSLFSYHKHHHHAYPPELPKNVFSRWAKFGFGALSVGIGIWAGYNYHRTADAAVAQANASLEANRLQRLALAKQHPEAAEEIYRNHPEEYKSFKKC